MNSASSLGKHLMPNGQRVSKYTLVPTISSGEFLNPKKPSVGYGVGKSRAKCKEKCCSGAKLHFVGHVQHGLEEVK